MLSADPERPERHGRLSTSERVHRGDVVALHRVWRSQSSPVCGGASAASTILGTCKPKSFTCNHQNPASRPCPLAWGFISSRGSVVTQDGSTVHGAGHVLEVADALLDGERPSQSCLRAAAGDRRVSKERSGGIAGLSARGLPIACPTTARRASTAVPWTAMPGSRAGLSLAPPPLGHDGAPSKSSRTFCSAQRL